MKTAEILSRMKGKAIFKAQDIERLALCKRKYANLILQRMKIRGQIKSVTKNVYTAISNIFVISSNISYPSYVSFWSASSFLGYTEQILSTVQVATTRKLKPIKYEGYTIKFIPVKYFFGYKKIRTEEGEIFIAEDEKLLIDSFLKPKELGNFDEIKSIFENAKISEEKILDYLKRLNNQSVVKRVGFLLEKTRGIDISSNFMLDKNYVLINPFSNKWKTTNSKWRVKA